MDLAEVLTSAVESIKRNKLRSSLTALGVIIGVASIILLISISSGLQNYISKEFEKLGANSLFITPGRLESSFGGGPPRSINKLTFRLMERLEREKHPAIVEISPFIEIGVTARYRNESKVTTLGGMKETYFRDAQVSATAGRLYTASENRTSRRVVVIGPSIAKDLYKFQNPIGKEITISGKTYNVLGILETRGNVGGVDADNYIYMPLNTARKLTGADQVNSVQITTTSTETLDEAKAHITKILDRTLSEDDYTILSQEQLLSTILQILGVLTAALGGIAAISLIVGGVGISNIMLVSVTERTREIGLRKAVGARPQDILQQFLTEAVILSVAGGSVGIAIGYLGSLAISSFIQTHVPLWAVLLGVGFSSIVGIVFGVAPAIRAAKLEPIEALRHE
jgi:putative ABC transport system permease protein